MAGREQGGRRKGRSRGRGFLRDREVPGPGQSSKQTEVPASAAQAALKEAPGLDTGETPVSRETPGPEQTVKEEEKAEAAAPEHSHPQEGGTECEPIAGAMAAMEIAESTRTRATRRERWNPYHTEHYRPDHIKSKQGTSGTAVMLRGNFFKLNCLPSWVLYQYHVTFLPPVESTKMRYSLLMPHRAVLGDVFAFDGALLFLTFCIPDSEAVVYTKRSHDDVAVKITIRLACQVSPLSAQMLQVMNIIWRKILRLMSYTQINRHYYDTGNASRIEKYRLEVIPGFETSILQYERDLLLEIDVGHRILRTNTVLDLMTEMYEDRREGFHARATKQIVGSIVITRYNYKTYKIDDIAWEKRPTELFALMDGNTKTFVDYYYAQYELKITNLDQPLLISRPKKRDIRRGQTEMILLVPELCYITGLTEEARTDQRLMREVALHTRISPEGRVSKLLNLRKSLQRKSEVVKELSSWNVQFDNSLVQIKGRQLPEESIHLIFRGKEIEVKCPQQEANWTQQIKNKSMRLCINLHQWMVIHPQAIADCATALIDSLLRVCPSLGMEVSPPNRLELTNDRTDSYVRAIEKYIDKMVQIVVCVLPTNRKDRYDAIKRFCCIKCPVPSQMVTTRCLSKSHQLLSVATKIAIQMNCKMGGVVWCVKIPLAGTMLIGIDTYHDSSAKGRSCGAVVATTNKDFSRYFSLITFQSSHQELHNTLRSSITACLYAFQKEQKAFPNQIIVYRDGVGDGQLDVVHKFERLQIVDAIRNVPSASPLKMALIVVKKRISARFFHMDSPHRGMVSNPISGTIIDDVVTNNLWYDFFLISQSVTQGTVTPTHYNIIADTTGLKPDHMQRLSYKLTHMYFNWQGTIRVPAPCMYAHKLAFLSGQSLHADFSPALADKLFFL